MFWKKIPPAAAILQADRDANGRVTRSPSLLPSSGSLVPPAIPARPTQSFADIVQQAQAKAAQDQKQPQQQPGSTAGADLAPSAPPADFAEEGEQEYDTADPFTPTPVRVYEENYRKESILKSSVPRPPPIPARPASTVGVTPPPPPPSPIPYHTSSRPTSGSFPISTSPEPLEPFMPSLQKSARAPPPLVSSYASISKTPVSRRQSPAPAYEPLRGSQYNPVDEKGPARREPPVPRPLYPSRATYSQPPPPPPPAHGTPQHRLAIYVPPPASVRDDDEVGSNAFEPFIDRQRPPVAPLRPPFQARHTIDVQPRYASSAVSSLSSSISLRGPRPLPTLPPRVDRQSSRVPATEDSFHHFAHNDNSVPNQMSDQSGIARYSPPRSVPSSLSSSSDSEDDRYPTPMPIAYQNDARTQPPRSNNRPCRSPSPETPSETFSPTAPPYSESPPAPDGDSSSEGRSTSRQSYSEVASQGSYSSKSQSDLDDEDEESEEESKGVRRRATVRRKVVYPAGLTNLGNSCYLNATVQCLAVTDPLSTYLLDGDYKKEINRTSKLGTHGQLPVELARLLGELKSAASSISPRHLLDTLCKFKPQFRGNEQQDAQELLDFLLDGLHEDLNLVVNPPPLVQLTTTEQNAIEREPELVAADTEWMRYRDRNDSIIIDFFQGQFCNKMTCGTCGQTSTTFNPFSTLSLPIPEPTRQMPQITMTDCLSQFLREEVLRGDNAWNCPRCRQPRTTSKALKIARLPQFLVIHLKRFTSFDTVAEKVNTPVHFPLNRLELGHLLPPDMPNVRLNLPHEKRTSYRLYALVNHFQRSRNEGVDSGHYTALVRSKEGSWFDIDDDDVEVISEQRVLEHKRSAYLLFYEIERR